MEKLWRIGTIWKHGHISGVKVWCLYAVPYIFIGMLPIWRYFICLLWVITKIWRLNIWRQSEMKILMVFNLFFSGIGFYKRTQHLRQLECCFLRDYQSVAFSWKIIYILSLVIKEQHSIVSSPLGSVLKNKEFQRQIRMQNIWVTIHKDF